MKIIVSEMILDPGIYQLQTIGNLELLPDLWQSRQQLLKEIKDADALIIRNQTTVDEEIFRAGRKLKVIGRLGAGLDNIDLKAAANYNVKVVSARNGNSISVAEYVMAAILSSSRPLEEAAQDVQKGNWNRLLFTGNEVYGKTLGLIGTGEIGHRLAKRAAAFGMRILGYDPFLAKDDYPFSETGIIKADLHEVLSHGDFISIHTPLTKDTKSLIGKNEFSIMKRNSILINTARGGIIDEHALMNAVEAGEISGAFLDVLQEEPVRRNNPMLHHQKIIITPHIAGLTQESQERVSATVTNEVMKVLAGNQSLEQISL